MSAYCCIELELFINIDNYYTRPNQQQLHKDNLRLVTLLKINALAKEYCVHFLIIVYFTLLISHTLSPLSFTPSLETFVEDKHLFV